VLKLDPRGAKAEAESWYPITRLSYQRLLSEMIALVEQQIEADPRGANTQVEWRDESDAAGRICQVLRVCHPQRDDALLFHTADVYIDRQWNLPVRIEAHGWPERAGEPLPLLVDYAFTDLELNVRHADRCFDAAALRGE
jgi:hypothetical protein